MHKVQPVREGKILFDGAGGSMALSGCKVDFLGITLQAIDQSSVESLTLSQEGKAWLLTATIICFDSLNISFDQSVYCRMARGDETLLAEVLKF